MQLAVRAAFSSLMKAASTTCCTCPTVWRCSYYQITAAGAGVVRVKSNVLFLLLV
jgi:hypothetical protein